ncbi:hypothetical protein NQ166_08780 [Microbacterium sp. zg.Y1090]|uniref:hypothetical protein n=1 Tax=Microbacterium wangruii TaxID=3049073 RepID=UPI00214D282A|nr:MULTISPECIES: hypothetical protein [unclassified Microbacterium]MCR2818920.1 hypothetical protein [Microbacterium sp. zg.Y1090]WIM27227.1 hypothetical protein QNO26_08590 [Microbacterium sp. zg-Y1090]
MRSLALCFDNEPLRSVLDGEAVAAMRPRVRGRYSPRSGYSDGELSRIVTAAREDVARMVHRLEQAGDATPPPSDMLPTRRAEAELVFLTQRDLTPMLVLLIANTGWNVESIKELPSSHRVIEGLAVEVDLQKRRRGSGNWHHTETWEIGPPGKELLTPGGTYLLLHRLMSAARAQMAEPAFWALWHATGKGPRCRNPFARSLRGGPHSSRWVERANIRSDGSLDGADTLLQLDFNRLKTSVDVRRTRQMGGHMPSSPLSNGMEVLFRNYLAGDASTIDWSGDVMSEAMNDLLATARKNHRDALAMQGRTQLKVNPTRVAATQPDETVDTAWAACVDHEHHPLTGRRCTKSFLSCFQCANCVVTGEHLPRLLSLLDALERRRREVSEADWWSRYGATWATIRYEVLPKFTEAELAHADQAKPGDSYLDLVEPRWERG